MTLVEMIGALYKRVDRFEGYQREMIFNAWRKVQAGEAWKIGVNEERMLLRMYERIRWDGVGGQNG